MAGITLLRSTHTALAAYFELREKTVRRVFSWFAIALLVLLAVVGGSLLLANRLAPPATGRPSHVLPLQPAQTEIDRELSPLLAANPGKTGAIFLTDGIDAFAARAISARKAGRSLDLQYFIWHDDLAGRLLASEAYDAAERGVRVRILLDDMNCRWPGSASARDGCASQYRTARVQPIPQPRRRRTHLRVAAAAGSA